MTAEDGTYFVRVFERMVPGNSSVFIDIPIQENATLLDDLDTP
jgi:hypothetical protein